jgi:hypothetical protein
LTLECMALKSFLIWLKREPTFLSLKNGQHRDRIESISICAQDSFSARFQVVPSLGLHWEGKRHLPKNNPYLIMNSGTGGASCHSSFIRRFGAHVLVAMPYKACWKASLFWGFFFLNILE